MRAILYTCITCLLLLAGKARAQPEPPGWPQTIPGDTRGKASSGWHAPFVHYTWVSSGKASMGTVLWFSKEGKIERELRGSAVSVHTYYINDTVNDSLVIYGLHRDWKFTLPKNKSGSISASRYGGTFFHEHYPTREQIAVDVYVDGKLKNTVGPFLNYKDHSIRDGEDGSFALVTWKDKTKKATQLVVAGPGGAERFKVDLDEDLAPREVTPDGQGALLATANKVDQRKMSFFRARGKMTTVDFKSNAWVAEWVPGTEIALMTTDSGHDYFYQLIDWPNAKRLWDIRDPCPARVPGYGPRTAVLKDYFLFAGREYVTVNDKKDTVRYLYAVDIRTGKTAARWHSVPMGGRPGETIEPMLGKHGDDIYFMTPDEYSLINVLDIIDKKRGWK